MYKSRQKKGQAAMEFLMTYGWVILIVIIVIGVLAYISLNSFRGNSQSVLSPPFIGGAVSIKDVGGGWSEVSFEVTNAGSRDLILTEAEIKGLKNGNCLTSNLGNEIVRAGAKTIVIVVCNGLADVSSGSLYLRYTAVGVLVQTSGREVTLNSRNAIQEGPNVPGGLGSPPNIVFGSLAGDSTPPYFTNDNTPDINLFTDVNSLCRWAFNDFTYSSMPVENLCGTNDGFSHSCTVLPPLSDGVKFAYVSCIDIVTSAMNNPGNNLDVIFTVDTIPPVQSGWYPSEGSSLGTNFIFEFNLNEPGTCKYKQNSITPVSYDDSNVLCDGTDTQFIQCSVSGHNQDEYFSIACRDTLGNKDSANTAKLIYYNDLS